MTGTDWTYEYHASLECLLSVILLFVTICITCVIKTHSCVHGVFHNSFHIKNPMLYVNSIIWISPGQHLLAAVADAEECG